MLIRAGKRKVSTSTETVTQSQTPTAITIPLQTAAALLVNLQAEGRYLSTVHAYNQVAERIRSVKAPFLKQVTKAQRETRAKAATAFDALDENLDNVDAEDYLAARKALASATAPIASAQKQAAEAVSKDDVAKQKELRKEVRKSLDTMATAYAMPLVQGFISGK
jgi:hypothetical protein